MSKAKLVITAVVLEGRSQTEVAVAYDISKGWVSRLVARYRVEGEAAFESLSRRPKTTPNATPESTVELIVDSRRKLAKSGLNAGPDTIRWHLTQHHQLTVSRATISRHLTRAGLVTSEPKKKPKSSYIRFEAAKPNETWQSDFTHYPLRTQNSQVSQDTEILTWLDDCTHMALRVTAHHRVTAPIVLAEFRHAVKTHGIPASTLTDNGMVFTTRLSGIGRQGGRNKLEAELRRLHVTQKNGNRTISKPRARSSDSNRRSKNGSAPSQSNQPLSLSCRRYWICSSTNTTTADRTGLCHTRQPQQPCSRQCPKRCPATVATPTPTTGSDTTESTKPGPSPCVSTAACTTSASA